MSMQRRRGKKNNTRRKLKQNKGSGLDKINSYDANLLNAGSVRIPPVMRAYPESFSVHMRYSDPQGNLNNVGSAFASVRYRMNSAYDPDPSLGGGTVDGYTFYTTIYGRYRVLKFSYVASCDNNDTFGKRLICWPSQTDLGANFSGTDQASELPKAKQIFLGAKGSGNENRTIRGSYVMARFYGSEQYNASDSSGANYNGNPGIILYFNVGTSAASNFVSGANLSIVLTYQVLWYSRENVASYTVEQKDLVERFINMQHGHGMVTNKELEEIQAHKLICDKLEEFRRLQAIVLSPPIVGGLSPMPEESKKFSFVKLSSPLSSTPPYTDSRL